MGKNTFQLIENGKVIASTTINVNDFIPVVEVDINQFKLKNQKWEYKGFKILSKKIVILHYLNITTKTM